METAKIDIDYIYSAELDFDADSYLAPNANNGNSKQLKADLEKFNEQFNKLGLELSRVIEHQDYQQMIDVQLKTEELMRSVRSSQVLKEAAHMLYIQNLWEHKQSHSNTAKLQKPHSIQIEELKRVETHQLNSKVSLNEEVKSELPDPQTLSKFFEASRNYEKITPKIVTEGKSIDEFTKLLDGVKLLGGSSYRIYCDQLVRSSNYEKLQN